jgi:hypothetical protein
VVASDRRRGGNLGSGARRRGSLRGERRTRPAEQVPAEANGLGQLTGLLPRDHLTQESAIQVNLSNETVRLPLYPRIAYKGTRTRRRSGTSCWTPPTQG